VSGRDRELARVRIRVLTISAVAWILLFTGAGALAHCAAVASGHLPWRASLQMVVSMNSPAALAGGWLLMLAAMMSPLLIAPIWHVRLQSFEDRRGLSTLEFVAGYAMTWMVAGAGVIVLEAAVAVFAPTDYRASVGLLTALLWQCSPLKQRCLNRTHVHPPLAAFGFAADLDALRFGVSHGIWCVGSCWALMLFPMLMPRGHVAAMAVTAFVAFSESMEHPIRPRWNWRLSTKLMRVILAQFRIRLNAFNRTAAQQPDLPYAG
jgi:predicted metal-binding membrane protein